MTINESNKFNSPAQSNPVNLSNAPVQPASKTSEMDKKDQVSAEDSDWKKVIASMENEAKRANEVKKKISNEDMAPGSGLTTGICAAYALECIDHVNKFGHLEEIPPLLTEKPSDLMKHTEMLLAKAIFQSLGDNQVYSDAIPDKNPELANKSCQTYHELIHSEFGLRCTEHYPKHHSQKDEKEVKEKQSLGINFCDSLPFELVDPLIDDLSKQNQGDHYLFQFCKPGQHLTENHVIYINFEKGIIADGDDGFMWKIASENKKLFPKAAQEYIKRYYKNWERISVMKIEKESSPQLMPLTLRKVNMYASILTNSLRTEGASITAIRAYNFIEGNETIQLAKKNINLLNKALENTTHLVKSSANETIKTVTDAINESVQTISETIAKEIQNNETIQNMFSAVSSLYYKAQNQILIKNLIGKEKFNEALAMACKTKETDLVKAILYKMKDSNNVPDLDFLICNAVKEGDLELLKAFHDAGVSFRYKGELTLQSISSGNHAMYQLLKDLGAEVSIYDFKSAAENEPEALAAALKNDKSLRENPTFRDALIEKDPLDRRMHVRKNYKFFQTQSYEEIKLLVGKDFESYAELLQKIALEKESSFLMKQFLGGEALCAMKENIRTPLLYSFFKGSPGADGVKNLLYEEATTTVKVLDLLLKKTDLRWNIEFKKEIISEKELHNEKEQKESKESKK